WRRADVLRTLCPGEQHPADVGAHQPLLPAPLLLRPRAPPPAPAVSPPPDRPLPGPVRLRRLPRGVRAVGPRGGALSPGARPGAARPPHLPDEERRPGPALRAGGPTPRPALRHRTLAGASEG